MAFSFFIMKYLHCFRKNKMKNEVRKICTRPCRICLKIQCQVERSCQKEQIQLETGEHKLWSLKVFYEISFIRDFTVNMNEN